MRKSLCFLMLFSTFIFSFSKSQTRHSKDSVTINVHYSCVEKDNKYEFSYVDNRIFNTEGYIFKKMSFEILFPKTFKNYMSNGEFFAFIFKHNQYIIMDYDISDWNDTAMQNIDTLYTVTKTDIDSIFNAHRDLDVYNYVMNNVKFNATRQHIIIKTKGITFILCNIREKDVGMFKKTVSTFKIINR